MQIILKYFKKLNFVQIRKTRSVVGFCATTNADFTQYFTTVKFQYDDVQLIAQLAECYDDALENFKSINGNYPVNIIVYRSGAGDGQVEEIVSTIQ